MSKPKRTVITIGPYHPLQEEAELFQLTVEGERVVDIDMRASYNHRGIEELAQQLTFDQVPFLVERVCGICSASHPLAYIQAVENIAGVEVPERALYCRTIVNELERIHSHVLWFGLAGHFIGYNTVFMWAWRYREPILDILEKVTGSRINYANAKIGGVRRDVPDELGSELIRAMDEVSPAYEMLLQVVLDDPVLHARLKGVGVLTREAAIEFGTCGPTARASGVDIDCRRDYPYAAYDRIDWKVITRPEGDVFAKAVVRLLEVLEAVKIIKQAVRDMPEGPLDAGLKDVPAGEATGHVEAPRGETFHYVRADGGNFPVRHKIRAPSYNNVPSFKASCIGQTISDVTITLASVDPCYSCTERMVSAVDASDGNRRLGAGDLVKLSQEKTHRLQKEMGLSEPKLELPSRKARVFF